MADNGTSSVPSKRKVSSQEDWENIKEDVFRIYILEDQTLNATMIQIESMHGLRAKEWRWRELLKEWNFKKKVSTHDWQWMFWKKAKRAKEGKGTQFQHRQLEVTDEMFQDFKKRGTGRVELDAATPSNITYNTPSPRIEGKSSTEEICEGASLVHSSPSDSSKTSLDHARHSHSICSFESETTRELTCKADLHQAPHSMAITQWLSHNDDPWSPVNMYYQHDSHEKAVPNHLDHLFEELERIEKILSQDPTPDFDLQEHLSDERHEQECSLNLQGTGGHLAFNPSRELEQQNIISEDAEDNTVAVLLSLEVKLAKLQYKHEELAPQAMETHFEMAKSLEGLGNYPGAEHHYRIITDRHCLPEVEVLLGSLLAKLGRVEESNTFLFRALTSFIIQFDGNSLQRNISLFKPIELLFMKLIDLREEDDRSLSVCMCQLMTTLRQATSDNTMSRVYPLLFIHGFSLAYECSILGFVEAADWMYYFLFKDCQGYLDGEHHALDKATAHRRYGLHLRMKQHWRSSAHQLLLACKAARQSATFDRDLCAELEIDYHELLPHLKDTLAERLRRSVALLRPEISLLREDISEPAVGLNIDRYFRSGLPRNFTRFELSALQQLDQFASPTSIVEPEQKGKVPTVTTSKTSTSGSGSRPYGKTFSEGEYSGVFEWMFAAPIAAR